MYVYVWTDTVDKKKLQTAYTLSLSLSLSTGMQGIFGFRENKI